MYQKPSIQPTGQLGEHLLTLLHHKAIFHNLPFGSNALYSDALRKRSVCLFSNIHYDLIR